MKRRKEETREKWRREREEKEMEKREKVGEKHLRKVELITGQWLSRMDSVRKVVNQHTHIRRIT